MWRGCYLLSYNEPAVESSCGSAGSTTHCIYDDRLESDFSYIWWDGSESSRGHLVFFIDRRLFFFHSWFMDDYSMWNAAKCWAAASVLSTWEDARNFSLNKQNFITQQSIAARGPFHFINRSLISSFLLFTIQKLFNLRLNFTHFFRWYTSSLGCDYKSRKKLPN